MQHINWDNLRYVLMVANKGSVSAAARELGVNRTTVLRRINTFQQDLNCRIFGHNGAGYALTPEAEKMIDAAREVENTLLNMQRQIAGRELKLEGQLRVTTTDTFMVSLLGPHLASFHRKHPHIVVEILTTPSVLSLDRRDADIAIRPTLAPDSGLVGKKLYEIRSAVYASPEFLQRDATDDYFQQEWIGFDTTLHATPLGAWLEARVPAEKICMRVDSLVGIRAAAENGIGLALLPCLLGDASERLARLPIDTSELKGELWLLTHPDLTRSARVNAFIDHFSEAFTVS